MVEFGPIDSIGLFLAIPTVAFTLMVIGHKLLVAKDEAGRKVAPRSGPETRSS